VREILRYAGTEIRSGVFEIWASTALLKHVLVGRPARRDHHLARCQGAQKGAILTSDF